MTPQELREFRKSIGMTQEAFGRMLNYHQAQIRISEFERGERKIPRRVVVACDYLRAKKNEKVLQSSQ